MNASKTVLKRGEPLTVNCTVHGVELVFFSWDIPNREVSRSGAEQELLFSSPFLSLMAKPRLHQDVEPHLKVIFLWNSCNNMWCKQCSYHFFLGFFVFLTQNDVTCEFILWSLLQIRHLPIPSTVRIDCYPNLDLFQHDDAMSLPSPIKTVEEIEPLTDVISSMNMRSCWIFPYATVAQSGNYVCHVRESVREQTASASINITVLG